MRKYLILLFLTTLCAPCLLMGTTLRPATVFSDEMVMQQKTSAPVWGFAAPGSTVSVVPSWNGRRYSVTADDNGHWRTSLATPSAGGPYTLSISSGSEKVLLKNVYIGEVWLASGQSNMNMRLEGFPNQPVEGSTDAIIHSAKTNIHYLTVPPLAAYKPHDDISGASWVRATPANAGKSSAVAWFFASELYNLLDVPVGIIDVSFSGSNIEAWMTPASCSEFDGIAVPQESDVTDEWTSNVPTLLYNGMLHPLEGYAIKGFLWYQGESSIFNVLRYGAEQKSLVKAWRELWGQGELPFYYVQIAPYDYTEWNFFTPQWPEISAYQRDEQRKCLDSIPNTGMVVTLDLGEEHSIHPRRKMEVGQRLARLALAKTYQFSGFEAESPEYDHLEIKDGTAVVHFRKQNMGMYISGDKLNLFEIAGDNHVFVPADAYIDWDNWTVVVSSRLVKEPLAVRYAFKNYVEAELFGAGGLPVSSFRTDDWK